MLTKQTMHRTPEVQG